MNIYLSIYAKNVTDQYQHVYDSPSFLAVWSSICISKQKYFQIINIIIKCPNILSLKSLCHELLSYIQIRRFKKKTKKEFEGLHGWHHELLTFHCESTAKLSDRPIILMEDFLLISATFWVHLCSYCFLIIWFYQYKVSHCCRFWLL